MTVFSVTSIAPRDDLEGAVQAAFPDSYLKVSPYFFLVAANGTAKEVWDKIYPENPAGESIIVFATAGYWGFAPSTVWEWIKAKLEAPALA